MVGQYLPKLHCLYILVPRTDRVLTVDRDRTAFFSGDTFFRGWSVYYPECRFVPMVISEFVPVLGSSGVERGSGPLCICCF